jgi:xylulokinase
MKDLVLGIDIGTSSVKLLLAGPEGPVAAASRGYGCAAEAQTPAVGLDAIRKATREMSGMADFSAVAAVSLAAQTGTYTLLDGGGGVLLTVGWASGEGEEDLRELREALPETFFLRHISMRHPALLSYPAPRIRWLRRERAAVLDRAAMLLQPKDFLYKAFTGRIASDRYTWRGLANPVDGTFHAEMLEAVGMEPDRLPELFDPWDAPGRLLPEAAAALGLRPETPVYVGCNDFFASLTGMGSNAPGRCFDLTGTSEHIGRIAAKPLESDALISGPYFRDYVQYGVTAASGTSLAWAQEMFPCERAFPAPEEALAGGRRPPLFLPHLAGERSPIWDPKARGVFFGLESGHGRADLLYSVTEGVAFSLYQISLLLPGWPDGEVRAAGGASRNRALNRMKASLFNAPIVPAREREAAALGAAAFAAAGLGWFPSARDAAERWVRLEEPVQPDAALREALLPRFEFYKELYPALKGPFGIWAAAGEG